MATGVLQITVLVGVLGLVICLDVLNQCPQATEANPDPPAFHYSHPSDCRYYYSCAAGKPRLSQCKPHNFTRYSEYFHTCVSFNTMYDTCTRSNAQRECNNGFKGFIGHPTACHRYYNCSQKPTLRDSLPGEYEAGCPFPQLFDIHELNCKPPKHVTCGLQRAVPTSWCDYVIDNCTGPHCKPCATRLS